jgi:hypothetical protein
MNNKKRKFRITECCRVKHKRTGKILTVDGWTEPEDAYVRQEVYFEEGGWCYAYEVEVIPWTKLEKALK